MKRTAHKRPQSKRRAHGELCASRALCKRCGCHRCGRKVAVHGKTRLCGSCACNRCGKVACEGRCPSVKATRRVSKPHAVPRAVEHGVGPDDSRWIMLPIKTRIAANGTIGHWRVRALQSKRELDATTTCLRALGRRPDADTWIVVMTRVSSGVADDDNVTGSLKHVRDAIAQWLGVDDGDTSRVRFVARAAKARESGVLVEVLPIRWQRNSARVSDLIFQANDDGCDVFIEGPHGCRMGGADDAMRFPSTRDPKARAVELACGLLSVGFNAGVRA